jgi:hypothetical protein
MYIYHFHSNEVINIQTLYVAPPVSSINYQCLLNFKIRLSSLLQFSYLYLNFGVKLGILDFVYPNVRQNSYVLLSILTLA